MAYPGSNLPGAEELQKIRFNKRRYIILMIGSGHGKQTMNTRKNT
jgi:hypothetical protein